MTSGQPDAVTFDEPDTWHTGTPLDEFTPIYLALAKTTKTHGSFTPTEVDGLDITVVAQLLGVQAGSYDDIAATELAEIRRRAEAGEKVTWGG